MSLGSFSHFGPIFSLQRAEIDEVVIYGHTSILHGEELLYGTQAALKSDFIPRSTLKPWQFLATNTSNTNDSFWTLGFASHCGQSIHQQALAKMIDTLDLHAEELKCPEAFPKDLKTAAPLMGNISNKRRVFHQCSGKHLMYLSACQKYGFDSTSYTSANHPLNRQLIQLLEKKIHRIPSIAYDSCGLPNYVFKVKEFLSLASQLASATDDSSERVFSLWQQNPRLVGGINRLDSDITDDLDGLFFAKEGADGILMLVHRGPKPIVCLVKLSSGYNQKHAAYALWCALKQVIRPPTELRQLRDYLTLKIRDYLAPDHKLAIVNGHAASLPQLYQTDGLPKEL